MSKLALLAIVLAPVAAHAEGELGPMFGGSILATHSEETDVAGLAAEMAIWYSRIGLGVEASRQWSVDDIHGPQVGSVSGSLRVLAFDHVVPSLLDSREVVDLGIELQGIVERTWWAETDAMVAPDPIRYGFGLALRLRGANDDDRSNLLAESRVFVRVMKSREASHDAGIAAREAMPGASMTEGVGVMIGLGAMFGGGKAGYVESLRRRNALDSEWMVR